MDRPRLRPMLEAALEDESGQRYILFDQRRLSAGLLPLSRRDIEVILRFDGRRSLGEIRKEFAATHSAEAVARLVEQLDEGLFLESPRFRERFAGPIRPAFCAG